MNAARPAPASKTWGVWDVLRERWLTNPGQLTEVQANRVALALAPMRYSAREQPYIVVGFDPGIEIVDRCGNTRKLADGSPCPGCRACA